MTIDFSGWTKATGDLKPGQQAVFFDFLTLVSEGHATLVHGANYSEGSPCLVNGVAPMLAHTSVNPMGMFPEVVSNFDRVCREMQAVGIGERPGRVSPLMAEFLMANFAERKDIDIATVPVPVDGAPYIEPSDMDMLNALNAMQDSCAPDAPVENPIMSDEQHDAEIRNR